MGHPACSPHGSTTSWDTQPVYPMGQQLHGTLSPFTPWVNNFMGHPACSPHGSTTSWDTQPVYPMGQQLHGTPSLFTPWVNNFMGHSACSPHGSTTSWDTQPVHPMGQQLHGTLSPFTPWVNNFMGHPACSPHGSTTSRDTQPVHPMGQQLHGTPSPSTPETSGIMGQPAHSAYDSRASWSTHPICCGHPPKPVLFAMQTRTGTSPMRCAKFSWDELVYFINFANHDCVTCERTMPMPAPIWRWIKSFWEFQYTDPSVEAERFCVFEYLFQHPKHCMQHEWCVAEITQNYITLLEADHTPCGRFHWLSLKDTFYRGICQG